MARGNRLALRAHAASQRAMHVSSVAGARFDVTVHSLVGNANGINTQMPVAIQSQHKE